MAEHTNDSASNNSGTSGLGGGSKLTDELAKLMTDAAGLAQGLKSEAETAIRSQSERFVSGMDLVHREDFDAVKEIAVRALDEVEELKKRVESLETQLDINNTGKTSK